MEKLTLETVAISSLQSDPVNARKHSKKNIESVANSLKLFGQRKPIVVTPDNIVLAGNGTLEAAKSLGWTEISIARTPRGWTYEQMRAFALADNRTAELAEWDTQILADQMLELDANGFNIFELGFEPVDLGQFEVEEIEPPSLEDGDKKPFQQITFTVHNEQADMIYQAIAKVKLEQDIAYPYNENSNANAIYAICKSFTNG